MSTWDETLEALADTSISDTEKLTLIGELAELLGTRIANGHALSHFNTWRFGDSTLQVEPTWSGPDTLAALHGLVRTITGEWRYDILTRFVVVLPADGIEYNFNLGDRLEDPDTRAHVEGILQLNGGVHA